MLDIQAQGCILLTYLSVISSKYIHRFAQKYQYFNSIDQSVPLYNFYMTFYLRTNQLWMIQLIFVGTLLLLCSIPFGPDQIKTNNTFCDQILSELVAGYCKQDKEKSYRISNSAWASIPSISISVLVWI